MKKIQIKNKSKTVYILKVDDKIWGILPSKILRFFSLKSGYSQVNDELMEKLKKEIEKYSWEKLLNYISYRERSVWECGNYLNLLPLKSEISGKLIQKAVKLNLIDNERFAELYVQDLIRKGKNKREISIKLMEKKIAFTMIQRIFDKYFTSEKQNEILEKNIFKALKKYAGFSKKERKEKCLNYLSRRGFSYSEINEKIDELIMKE